MSSRTYQSGEDWMTLVSLFDELVDLKDEERDVLLNNSPAKQRIKDKVISMLEHSGKQSIFDHPISSTINLHSEGMVASDVPDSFNQYQVVKVIRSTQQSIVFEAIQSDPVQRRVAIKIAHPDASQRQKEMFSYEQQRIARLNHPFIGQIYAVEVDGAGDSFTVMELIEGGNILSYAEKFELDLFSRLRLFRQVCDAVIYSHSMGVIHCDIKPENILVRENLFEPAPAVIDFGVARVFSERLDADRQSRGSLKFASPEQFEGPQYVDVRSDIFSLGLLLGDLLRLQRLETRNESFEEQHRHSQFPLLWSSADDEKDFGHIVQKATARNPERRYQSVLSLRDELDRFLNKRPIKARAPSTLYKLGKFRQRNPILTKFALAMVCVAALFLSGIIYQATVIETTSSTLNTAKEALIDSEYSSQALESFILDIIVEGHSQQQDANTGRYDLINAVELGIRQFLLRSDVPEAARYRVLDSMVKLFLNFSDYERAKEFNEIILGRVGYPDPSLDIEGLLNDAWIASETGDYKTLEANASKSRDIAENNKIHGLLKARILDTLGGAQFRNGDLQIAKQTFEDALSEYEESEIKDNRTLSRIYFLLASVNSSLGNFEQALKHFENRLALNKRIYGENDPLLLANSAETEYARVRLGKGDASSIEALTQHLNYLEGNVPNDIKTVLSRGKLAVALQQLNQHQQAKQLLLENLDLTLEIRGKASIEYLYYSSNLVRSLLVLGEFEKAKDVAALAMESLTMQPHLENSKYGIDAKLADLRTRLVTQQASQDDSKSDTTIFENLQVQNFNEDQLNEVKFYQCHSLLQNGKPEEALEVGKSKTGFVAQDSVSVDETDWLQACLHRARHQLNSTPAKAGSENVPVLSQFDSDRAGKDSLAFWEFYSSE